MPFPSRFKSLFRASRPTYWTTTLIFYLIGLLQAGSYPQSVPEIMLAVAFSAPMCLVVMGGSDIHDYESDIRNPRKSQSWLDGRSIEKADHAFILQACKVATLGVVLLAVPASFQSPQTMVYVLIALGASWAYGSPPIRLKGRPFLDSLCTGTLYWSIWASGFCLRDGERSTSLQTSNPSIWIFFSCAGLQMLTAVLDRKADSAANIRTIATACGERVTALFSAITL
ncbi:prenyltransferase [Trichophyton equinum CBS 127.97]|uniref:Prenyltransferase n=1 Tax=Trichophyton equinum (strain ATCC MYA-4606 / CBS 127.97) TaxID=559882 RepID=F2Q2P0_TRIEC|nr:prenyltransferase [Trichophyton equinum CBS 127.97]